MLETPVFNARGSRVRIIIVLSGSNEKRYVAPNGGAQEKRKDRMKLSLQSKSKKERQDET
jgi:hypothetical protein